jgi:hypothetical protein
MAIHKLAECSRKGHSADLRLEISDSKGSRSPRQCSPLACFLKRATATPEWIGHSAPEHI